MITINDCHEDAMRQKKKYTSIDRREFLRIGLAGTTSVLFGWEGLADAMQIAASGSFIFPAPVYRTLGRTGLKITIVSFGAMLTPESEVQEMNVTGITDRTSLAALDPLYGAVFVEQSGSYLIGMIRMKEATSAKPIVEQLRERLLKR
jgi:hypothetical protein